MFIYLLFNLILTEHIDMSIAHRHIAPRRRACLHPTWVARGNSLLRRLEDKWFEYIEIEALLGHNIRGCSIQMVDKVVGYNARKMYRATALRRSIGHT